MPGIAWTSSNSVDGQKCVLGWESKECVFFDQKEKNRGFVSSLDQIEGNRGHVFSLIRWRGVRRQAILRNTRFRECGTLPFTLSVRMREPAFSHPMVSTGALCCRRMRLMLSSTWAQFRGPGSDRASSAPEAVRDREVVASGLGTLVSAREICAGTGAAAVPSPGTYSRARGPFWGSVVEAPVVAFLSLPDARGIVKRKRTRGAKGLETTQARMQLRIQLRMQPRVQLRVHLRSGFD